MIRLKSPTIGKQALEYPNGKFVAFDVETTGLYSHQGHRIFCWAYFTEMGEYGFMLKNEQSLKWLNRLVNDPTKTIICHNAKFELKMLLAESIDIYNAKATFDCTLILSKLFNGMMFDYSLRSLGIKFCDRETSDKDEIEQWVKSTNKSQGGVVDKQTGKRRPANFSDAPVEVIQRRVLWDVETTLYLYWIMRPKVREACEELYKTERDLMFVVCDMETTGVSIDITRAKMLRAQALKGMKLIQGELDKLVCPLTVCRTKKRKRKGEVVEEVIEESIDSFNVNSPKQMPIAFEKLGVKLRYKTKPKKGKKGKAKTGGGRWAFDESTLIKYISPELAETMRVTSEEGWPFHQWHEAILKTVQENGLHRRELLAPLIVKLRELSKMVSTYYDHFINDCVDVHTEPSGRIVGTLHVNFNQSEAMTGRFSSSNVNLQNQPRMLGPRECFIVPKGRIRLHIDYEQVEMKFFAHFAQDEGMANAIKDDIHKYVASRIYRRPIEEVTKEQRKRAKQVNFGTIYGVGAETLAETLTKFGLPTTIPESQWLVNQYHSEFPSVRRTTNAFKQEIARNGYVTNPYGRRYHIPFKVAYKALNYMCQGTSADLMKRAMVAVWKWLRKNAPRCKLVLTVHDEIAIDCTYVDAPKVYKAISSLMEDHKNFMIPITVDVEVVKRRWSEKMSPEKAGLKAA